MNKEILTVVDAVPNEKGVEKEIIFDALEAAFAREVCGGLDCQPTQLRLIEQRLGGEYYL